MSGRPSIGVALPTFTSDGNLPVLAATVAEAGGLEGAFVFDHLWPMGAPGRPSLWSFAVLGAVVAATSGIAVGPLVARYGLLPDADLIRMFETLAAIGGQERIIAALGVGDTLSAGENRAYGLEYAPAAIRLAALADLLDVLRGRGFTTWMGARSPASIAVAAIHADTLNTWGSTVEEVRLLGAWGMEVTWGGQVLVGRDQRHLSRLLQRYGARPGVPTGTVTEVAAHLRALGGAGAMWCVMAPLDYLDDPRESIETVCLVAEAVR